MEKQTVSGVKEGKEGLSNVQRVELNPVAHVIVRKQKLSEFRTIREALINA